MKEVLGQVADHFGFEPLVPVYQFRNDAFSLSKRRFWAFPQVFAVASRAGIRILQLLLDLCQFRLAPVIVELWYSSISHPPTGEILLFAEDLENRVDCREVEAP